MKQRPSILFVNRVYPPTSGASGRLMHDLARHFVRTGHKVTILTTDASGASHKSRGPITIARVKGASKPTKLGYALVLWRLYRAMLSMPRHDVLITLSDPPLLYMAGARVAAHKSCRHIHWCHDVYPDLLSALGYTVPARIKRWLAPKAKAALDDCSRIVAISTCMQRYLIKSGQDIRHLSVIENWPDLELTGDAPAPKPEVSTAKALPHTGNLKSRRLYSSPAGEKFRVLYAGNIGRAHPTQTVVDAARILQKTNPDIEFVFVGKGEGYDRLSQMRAVHNLDNIRLMPPQPRHRLKALMESGDIHLITMKDEAAGLLLPCKFYSALAASRPVLFVGPPESDIARIISQTGCGRTLKGDQPKLLANEIARMRTQADAWFSAHEGTKTALSGRRAKDAFAKWSDVIRQVVS